MDLRKAVKGFAPLLLPEVLPVLHFHRSAFPPAWWRDEDDVDGLCWDEADGAHIWIHSELAPEDASRVLLHELCHAAVGPEHMHDWVFQELLDRASSRLR